MINITRILICLSIVEMSAVRAEARPIYNSVALASRYLTEYGYIESSEDTISKRGLYHQLSQLYKGVKKFQSFMGINESGVLDESTLHTMRLRRCGNKDIIYSQQRRFSILKRDHWPFSNISYGIGTYPKTLSREKTARTIRKAFDIWSKVVPLEFKETKLEKSNIKINFFVGEHGDGSPFAEERESEYTLAHSTPYPNSFIHFSNLLVWKVGHVKEGEEDLLEVAAHEIGHVLGLDHSTNKKALMFATSEIYMKPVKLHQDDIEGVQSIYGKKEKRRYNNQKPKRKNGHKKKNVKKNKHLKG